MKQTLKSTAIIAGIIAAAWLTIEALISLMWVAYYAGIPM